MRYDTAVVGGGPAGSFSAKACAKHGETIIFEEHETQPVACAGLISKSGLERVGVNTVGLVLNEIEGAKLYSPGGVEVVVDPKKTKAYVVDRRSLDERLLCEAVEAGARLVKGRVTKVGGGVVSTGGRAYGAGRVVLATGSDYTLVDKLGFQRPSECLVGAQYELKVEADPAMVELHFVVPEFFAWVIPVDGVCRVGICTTSNPTPHLKSFLAKLKREGRARRNAKVVAKNYGVIPVHSRNLRSDYQGVVLVGDAAGHVKATTGGGVVMGALAAAHTPYPDYERRWRAEIGRELAIHLFMYRFITRLSSANRDRFFSVLAEASQSLEESGDMDVASKTLKSLVFNPRFTFGLLRLFPSIVADLV